MEKDIQFKGQLKLYMQWPMFMTLLLMFINVWVYVIDKRIGILMSLIVIIYGVTVCILYNHNKSLILSELTEFAIGYSAMQNIFLKELPTPYAILSDDGKIIWCNDQFQKLIGDREEKYIHEYVPELGRRAFPEDEGQEIMKDVNYQGRIYEVGMSKLSTENFKETDQLLEIPEGQDSFVTIYLNDVTELRSYIKENEEQRLVAGLIYIDNYDEIMDSVEEVRQSLLVALIDRKINQYIGNVDGLVKKMEKDKYFIVIKKQAFNKIKEDKFSILEEVKNVNIGNEVPATLSIGLGFHNETYAQSYNYARVSIDLALARGGDQAVIKYGSKIEYFGGKREQTSRNTRVKARVKAEALREFVAAKDKVMIMGHKLGDVDSFGAAIGIYRAVVEMKKEAHIIINDITASVRPLYEEFVKSPVYPEDMFLKSKNVDDYMNDNTMVVVVDTNKPELTECEELLNMSKTIVVLDHHRQGDNVIEGAILSYIEPYASSACEMVAEVLQYMIDGVKLPNIEANSLYAGIMIDTNNFMNRTGVRTFEAAAFLRRCGADITLIRKMFRENMETYRAKSEIISKAEIYRDVYAIATSENSKVDSPTIIGAQAANELLDIEQIKASFVLTAYYGKIYVSARAIDEVNVQIIMERIGGGGHLNTAGAQFHHTDMEKAVATIKETIDIMIEEGDI